MKLLLALSFASLFTSGALVAQTKSTLLTGAWRVTQIQTPGTKGETISGSKIQGLFLFTGGNYSFMWVIGPRPDLPEHTSKPTADDLLAAWGPFVANSGRYEIQAGTLTVYPVVAKNPNAMGPGVTRTYSFKFEGNTLTLTVLDSGITKGRVTRLERVE